MGWGGVTGTERMPSLIGGNTERAGSKLKSWKGFLKPNLEPGPNRVRSAGCLYPASLNFTARYDRSIQKKYEPQPGYLLQLHPTNLTKSTPVVWWKGLWRFSRYDLTD